MDIPFRLNLEQQKKRAKELLKCFQCKNTDAIIRFERNHPTLIHQEQILEQFQAKLADAQLVIARELGCKTWHQLKNHIVLMGAIRGELSKTNAVTDEPKNCLHIRCGSDIEKGLFDAGFSGDFLEFSDPLCMGPVDYDYKINTRVQFLQNSFGESLATTSEKMLSRLTTAHQRLQHSAQQYEHVILWFEHDPYDQFILIFLLSYYHRYGRPKHLWLVTTNAFPGTVRFQGLGQLPPEGLRLLWQTKHALTAGQCLEADTHWAAYTNSDPTAFHQHIHNLKRSTLPYFQAAALRQLQEQPIEQNQRPLTQQLTLELLNEASPQSAGELFRKLMTQKEPMPFLGDLMYWHILRQMKAQGLVQFVQTHEHWPKTTIQLTRNAE